MLVRMRSFAKINLGLWIGASRADGFHELLTVYQTIGLHDVMRVSVVRGSGIEIRCDDSRVPTDESNTCFRIVEKALQSLRAKGRVIIEIEKRLPVQGGLGGASANAVTALLGLERALKKPLPMQEKLRIAAEVGSDLPLFLIGGAVVGVGRGEQVYPLPDFPSAACVVVTPDIGVSTPKAFAEWDRMIGEAQRLNPLSPPDHRATLEGLSSMALPKSHGTTRSVVAWDGVVPTELRSARRTKAPAPTQPVSKLTLPAPSDRMNGLSRELSAWLSEAYSGAPFRRGRAENPLLELVRAGIDNDFEQVVFPEYPELRKGKLALEQAGARYASLSGSGSTLYGLFSSRQSAARAVSKLRKQGWKAQATLTLKRAQYWKRVFDC